MNALFASIAFSNANNHPGDLQKLKESKTLQGLEDVFKANLLAKIDTILNPNKENKQP